MRVVVGLRNPGPEYEGTRHNVGFEVVEAMLVGHGEAFGKGPGRVRCLTGDIRVGSDRLWAAVPMSYMNESGSPIRSLLDYFDIVVTDLLVVHDDIDLPFGRLRIQHGGGTGGHNGLRSIVKAIGDDFSRLKVGVGRPPGSMDPADYVLRRFAKAERAEVDLLVGDAVDVIEAAVADMEAATRMAGERRPA